MASVSKQGARTLLAKNKPNFNTTYDLLHRTTLFNIEVPDNEGKVIKVSLPENEVKQALRDWKRKLENPKEARTRTSSAATVAL